MTRTIRRAARADLPGINDIYNHYVRETAITFDIEPWSMERRTEWFTQFADHGRHQLLVAVDEGGVIGFAGTHQFRTKAAYDTTVETTVYLAPGSTGGGVGSSLYAALFDAIADADIYTLIAGITMPNDASVALHRRFGFADAGVMHAVGRKFERFWDVLWMEKAARA
jgi:phosphinothricin acetyltransferase